MPDTAPPPDTSARRRAWLRRATTIAVIAVATLVVSGLLGTSVLRSLVAVVAVAAILRLGYAMISGLAQPVPEPPPVGELRKVKIGYRCSVCGAEVRMTVAPDADPAPPRHCLEDMELVAPIE